MRAKLTTLTVCFVACNLPVYTSAGSTSTTTGGAPTSSSGDPSTSTTSTGTTADSTTTTTGEISPSTGEETTSTTGDPSSTSTGLGATTTTTTTGDPSTTSTGTTSTSTTDSEFDLCVDELGPAYLCAECACTNCVAELDACAADAGCSEIWPCVRQTECGNNFDCLEECGDLFVLHGGPFGASGVLVQAITSCVSAQCQGQC